MLSQDVHRKRSPSLLLILGAILILLGGNASALAPEELAEMLELTRVDPLAGFAAWQLKHDVQYPSVEVEEEAFALWMERVELVVNHNADTSSSYKLTLNHLSAKALQSSITPENGRSLAASSTLQKLGIAIPTTVVASSPQRFAGFSSSGCPASLDWRSVGAVTPVKNQAGCGSCWTFSATGAIEGAYFIATNNLVSVSEQQLLDCTYPGTAGICAVGGWPNAAFTYIVANGGIATEDSYPYVSGGGTAGVCDSSKAANTAFTLSGQSYVTATSGGTVEQALMQAVCQQPVTITLFADATFQAYSSGVYTGAPSCMNSINHAVLVVGFDTVGGQDFWIVKNQWGTGWGEAGYIRILRNQNVCNIALYPPNFPTVAAGPPTPPPSPPSSSSSPPPPPVGSCPTTYTVMAGDGMYTIAAQFGLSLIQLENANQQVTNADLINVGDSLTIPCGGSGPNPTPSFNPAPSGSCPIQYTVASGDSLYAIASSHSITLAALEAANGQIINFDLITIGTVLSIPCSSNPAPSSKPAPTFNPTPNTGTCKYTVASGDSLYAIAQSYSITLAALEALNGQITNFDLISIGTVLSVPCSSSIVPHASPSVQPPSTSCPTKYTIKSGDGLYAVATANGISLAQLQSANPAITNPNLITVGQVINIPCKSSRKMMLSVPVVSSTQSSCAGVYTVLAGDTLYKIATKYNVALQTLLNNNPQFINPSLIHLGDIVHIPPCTSVTFAVTAAQSARSQCVNTTYTAVGGDYLYKISANMNSYVGDLLKLNPARAKMTNSVPAGTVLKVLKCPPGARVPYATAAAVVKKPIVG